MPKNVLSLLSVWFVLAAGSGMLFISIANAGDAEPSYEVDYENAGGYTGPSQKGPASVRRKENPDNYIRKGEEAELFTSPGQIDLTGQTPGNSRFFGVYGPDKGGTDEDDG
jgi:hypothetical protein